jgi:hypothetical protein
VDIAITGSIAEIVVVRSFQVVHNGRVKRGRCHDSAKLSPPIVSSPIVSSIKLSPTVPLKSARGGSRQRHAKTSCDIGCRRIFFYFCMADISNCRQILRMGALQHGMI